jgi:DNA-binding response OmpR family regulator
VHSTETAVEWPIQVLLVEDDEEAAWLVQTLLEETGREQFRIEWTQSVLGAMTRLAQPGIEVVVLDLGLPELTGYRSFRAIESAGGGSVPVVILTSDERPISRDLTMGFGASDYLVKGHITSAQLRHSLFDAVHYGRPAAR